MVRNAPNGNLIQQLKRQRGFAWSKYYKVLAEKHDMEIRVWALMNELHRREERPDAASSSNDREAVSTIPGHLTKEVEDMMSELKKSVECPVCLEPIAKGKLKITGCGHKYCETCLKKLDKCAICRRKIKK